MPDISLHIIVKPRAPRNEVRRTPEGVLVRVTAAPTEGAANTAVIKTLAGALGVPKSRLAITAGASARLKRVTIAGLTQQELASRLAALPSDA